MLFRRRKECWNGGACPEESLPHSPSDRLHSTVALLVYGTAVTLAILLLIAGLFLAREPILMAIGDHLVIQDELQPADLIHVLAGPDRRAEYGIHLYRQGYGSRIFFTGGWSSAIDANRTEYNHTLAVEAGVPPQAIALDPSEVTSTYSEAVRLKLFIDGQPQPVRSVIAVSDPLHTRRVQWSYRQVLGNAVEIRMAPLPFEHTPYRRRWWTNEESRHAVFDEYSKAVYYLARYRLGCGPLSEWLASFDRE